MEANELRKGNIVDWHGERAVIAQIWDVEVVFECGEIGMIDDIKPVPVTNRFLEKHVFSKMGNEWFKDSFVLEQDKNGLLYYSAGEGLKLSPYIESVHQLQNLYFAHTLKELVWLKRK